VAQKIELASPKSSLVPNMAKEREIDTERSRCRNHWKIRVWEWSILTELRTEEKFMESDVELYLMTESNNWKDRYWWRIYLKQFRPFDLPIFSYFSDFLSLPLASVIVKHQKERSPWVTVKHALSAFIFSYHKHQQSNSLPGAWPCAELWACMDGQDGLSPNLHSTPCLQGQTED
jgi:hypothetical protein